MMKSTQIVFGLYLAISLSLFVLLIYEYCDYSMRISSIRKLEVKFYNSSVYREGDKLYLNISLGILNEGVKKLEVTMVTYKIYFRSEIARAHSENFYGSPLVLAPGAEKIRTVKLEVPEFKLKRNIVNNTVKVTIVLDVYIKTRFGNTPVTFTHEFNIYTSEL